MGWLGKGHLGEVDGEGGLDPEDVADVVLGGSRLQTVRLGAGLEHQNVTGDPLVRSQGFGVDRLRSGGKLTQPGDVGVL